MSTRLAEAQAALQQARDARMTRALDLFGPPAELTPVDDPVERVGSHVSTQWRAAALEAVRVAATSRDVLTVEDVAWPNGLEPYDDRARGSVMRTAARSGWIKSTGEYRRSARPETHRRPLLVWQSRLSDRAAP